MNAQTMTAEDWRLYRKSYREVQRMDARASLRRFYARHLRCIFDIEGQTMSGRKVTDRISIASDKRLSAYHEAAERQQTDRAARALRVTQLLQRRRVRDRTIS